jgi:hypothetical protein
MHERIAFFSGIVHFLYGAIPSFRAQARNGLMILAIAFF